MIGDYLKLALGSIMHRKLRSWLTMVGIFIGVMAVVALISLGDGLQETVNSEFERVGSNRISILPGGGGGQNALLGAGGFSSAKLTERDVDAVRKVRGVKYATGMLRNSVRVEFAGETNYLMLFCMGTTTDDENIIKGLPFFEIERGKQLQAGDKHKATVGKFLTEDVFEKKVSLNDKLLIEGQSFTVVGVYKKASEPVHNYKVVLTKDMCDEMFNNSDGEVSMISAEVDEGFNTTQVAEGVKEKLRRERGVKKDEEDFTVTTPEDIMRIFLTVINMVQFVLTGIAAISLVVGAIGIMNTMYTSVIERTREIGIMKAVGARNSSILTLFVIEAGLLGVVGGVIGTCLGLGMAKAVELVAVASGLELLRVNVSFSLILGAMAFSFFVGGASGALPALQASNLKPVEALRK